MNSFHNKILPSWNFTTSDSLEYRPEEEKIECYIPHFAIGFYNTNSKEDIFYKLVRYSVLVSSANLSLLEFMLS